MARLEAISHGVSRRDVPPLDSQRNALTVANSRSLAIKVHFDTPYHSRERGSNDDSITCRVTIAHTECACATSSKPSAITSPTT